MSISFQAAVNAYQNVSQTSVSNATNNVQDIDNSQAQVFTDVIKSSAAGSVNKLQQAEKASANALMKQADITDVVSAITDAELTLKTVVAVRDKLISAHQEILRMPI